MMINQVLLKGVVTEIEDGYFEMQLEDGNKDKIFIYDVADYTISNLLLNNKVAVRGHLKISNNGLLNVICDSVIILDGRGRKWYIKSTN